MTDAFNTSQGTVARVGQVDQISQGVPASPVLELCIEILVAHLEFEPSLGRVRASQTARGS